MDILDKQMNSENNWIEPYRKTNNRKNEEDKEQRRNQENEGSVYYCRNPVIV